MFMMHDLEGKEASKMDMVTPKNIQNGG